MQIKLILKSKFCFAIIYFNSQFFINSIYRGILMKIRLNKKVEEYVANGLELSLKGDNFSALSFMKNHGVPNEVIACVLYQQDQVRSSDLSIINKYKLDIKV